MNSVREILHELSLKGISVSVNGDNIVANGPKGSLTSDVLATLKSRKDEIIGTLELHGTEPARNDDRMPLSRAQKRIWFLDKMNPGNLVWNIALAFRLCGKLDRSALERSFREILRRHEVLRTAFYAVDGLPQARLVSVDDWKVSYDDLRDLPIDQRESSLLCKASKEAQSPFNLECGPLFRVGLLQANDDEYLLVMVTHHIVADGWSLGVLSTELTSLYGAFAAGRPSPLAELDQSYRDYVAWERDCDGKNLTDIAWWREKVGGQLPVLELPSDRSRAGGGSAAGRRISVSIPKDLGQRLVRLARAEGVTTFMLLLSAFKVLLCRYTGVDDVVVGTATSYRNQPGFSGLVGMFVNSIVLRSDLSGNPRFDELLRRVRTTVTEAFAHQGATFDQVVEAVQPKRDAHQSPLFQVMFAFQNFRLPLVRLEGLEVARQKLELSGARYDLSVEIWNADDEFVCDFEFATDIWNEASIARMQSHYLRILDQCAEEATYHILDVPLLTEAERQSILGEAAHNAREYPLLPVHSIFEREALRDPAAIAVTSGQAQLSYGDLNCLANQFAHVLADLGVKTETAVGLCLIRSPELIAMMLASLKAGGLYVPLDLNYPVDRLRAMITDADIEILVTDETEKAEELCRDLHVRVVDIRALMSASSAKPTVAPAVSSSPDQLAYIMYTSGTTGVPNGVEVIHRGIVRLVTNPDYVRLSSETVTLSMAPATFDASTFEIWAPLLNGGRCVLYPAHLPDAVLLSRVLKQCSVNTLWLTASVFNWIIDSAPETLSTVAQLLIGGEALSVPHVRRALSKLPQADIINGYGPTENTTFTCCYLIPREIDSDIRSIPIGRPIAGTKAVILDARLQPSPVGAIGELCVGGDGLARGYRNRAKLNAEKFISDPLRPPERLYRTGDLARYLTDGTIEFIGRRDHQVKVRGHRVELSEIDHLVSKHPGARVSVTEVRRHSTGDDIIVTWFVPSAEKAASTEDIRMYLESRLPRYSIPNIIAPIAEIPLLAHGKVDRAMVSAQPLPNAESAEKPLAPVNGAEKLIAQAMAEVLQVDRVGVDDDFFALGGHSMAALRLAASLEEKLGRPVSPALFFQAPSVTALSSHFAGLDSASNHFVTLNVGGTRPPLFCMHGLDAGVHYFLNLVRHLDHEQPVFGLRPGPLLHGVEKTAVLEVITSAYASEIRRIYPTGPYRICGYSFGGIPAFEVARQIAKHSDDVLLVLIDAFNYRSRPRTSFVSTVLAKAKRIVQLTLQRQLLAKIEERRNKTPIGIADVPVWVPADNREFALNLGIATTNHKLQRSNSAAVLFQVSDRSLTFFPDVDGQNGWRGLMPRGFSVVPLDGDHHNIMREPAITNLAAKLTEVLAVSESRNASKARPDVRASSGRIWNWLAMK